MVWYGMVNVNLYLAYCHEVCNALGDGVLGIVPGGQLPDPVGRTVAPLCEHTVISRINTST